MRYIPTLLLYSTILFHSMGQSGYQNPPQQIKDLVDASLTPSLTLNDEGNWMLLLQRNSYPSIDKLAAPELRIAGARLNPGTNGPSRSVSYNGIVVKNRISGIETIVSGLPENASISNVTWSPTGEKFAFTLTELDGISLWYSDVKTASAMQLTGNIINDAASGTPFSWIFPGDHIVYRSINTNRGTAPNAADSKPLPIVQENKGVAAPNRTYQDLLKNQQDESLFDFYFTAEVWLTDLNKNGKKLKESSVITRLVSSPDGKYIILESISKPYSYLVPYNRFPTTIEVLDIQGKSVKTLAQLPLAEDLPKGFDATRKGPRSVNWRSDKPATLYWVEALDGGDPAVNVSFRDRLFTLDAPFAGSAKSMFDLKYRFAGIDWGTDKLAIIYERYWSTRKTVATQFEPAKPTVFKNLWDRNYEDRYADPGTFVTTDNGFGRSVLLSPDNGKSLYLFGTGASNEGNRPFVDLYDIKSAKSKRLWQSEAPFYERPIAFLDAAKGQVITLRESNSEQPNYFLRDLNAGTLTAVTNFEHPYPSLSGVTRELITYQREDGVQLSGTLYLPAGYKKEDGRLPVFLWAYPREFKSADAAGQINGSPYEFIRLNWGTPIYWVTRGYAVFDNASMPIIGEGDEEPNDSFVKQLDMNAKAAVGILDQLGVGDPNRIAIGGHSYGAFMTANLLAHTDYFAAGIARSGAYNRTLTPFGFQAEERTFWEAPDVYFKMSPFNYANTIKEPLLLIHGEADNNSGTFPMQSERFYNALKGHGATTRLVMLPHESHGYAARESILHTLWEMDQWLEQHVKNKKPPMDTELDDSKK